MAQNDCLFFLMEEHVTFVIIGQDAGSLRSEVCDHNQAARREWWPFPRHASRAIHVAIHMVPVRVRTKPEMRP